MKTRWSYLILGSLILLAQSDGMARSYSGQYDYGSRHHHWSSSSSSGNTGGTSSTNNNSSVDTGNSSTNTVSDGTGAASNSCNTAQTVIDDMTLPASSLAAGDTWDNGQGQVEAGNDAPSWANSLTGWGAIGRDVTNSNDTNTVIEVKNFRVYLLHDSGEWETLNSTTDVDYQGYKNDYSSTASLDDERTMPDGGVAVRIPRGNLFHFWPPNNVVSIDTGDISGIFVTYQARLIVNDSSLPDDRSIARYVGDSGADYYGNGKCCAEDGGEIGGGRAKFLTVNWQWFNFTTIPTSQFASTQPPLECK